MWMALLEELVCLLVLEEEGFGVFVGDLDDEDGIAGLVNQVQVVGQFCEAPNNLVVMVHLIVLEVLKAWEADHDEAQKIEATDPNVLLAGQNRLVEHEQEERELDENEDRVDVDIRVVHDEL